MKKQVKYLVLVGAAAALAGCGGSGGATLTTGPNYADLVTRADAAAVGIVDLDSGVVTSPSTAVPDSGTADYKGYVQGDLGGGELIGELSLTADFANAEITGTATNFQHSDRGAYAGVLYMDDTHGGVAGTIEDRDPAITTDAIVASGILAGTLTNGGVDYAASISLDGNFVGGDSDTDPSAIAGIATGKVGAEDLGANTGGFIVLKQ